MTTRVPHVVMWSDEHEARNAEYRAFERDNPTVTVNLVPFMGDLAYSMPENFPLWTDEHGIIWDNPPSTRGGEPMFAQVHALRQRDSVLNARCQVCAVDVGQNTVWHISQAQKHERGLVTTDAPTCTDCAYTASVQCPHLSKTLPTGGSQTLEVFEWEWFGVMGYVRFGDRSQSVVVSKEEYAKLPPRVLIARQAAAIITSYERIE